MSGEGVSSSERVVMDLSGTLDVNKELVLIFECIRNIEVTRHIMILERLVIFFMIVLLDFYH